MKSRRRVASSPPRRPGLPSARLHLQATPWQVPAAGPGARAGGGKGGGRDLVDDVGVVGDQVRVLPPQPQRGPHQRIHLLRLRAAPRSLLPPPPPARARQGRAGPGRAESKVGAARLWAVCGVGGGGTARRLSRLDSRVSLIQKKESPVLCIHPSMHPPIHASIHPCIPHTSMSHLVRQQAPVQGLVRMPPAPLQRTHTYMPASAQTRTGPTRTGFAGPHGLAPRHHGGPCGPRPARLASSRPPAALRHHGPNPRQPPPKQHPLSPCCRLRSAAVLVPCAAQTRRSVAVAAA
jgi:hypothetical protein